LRLIEKFIPGRVTFEVKTIFPALTRIVATILLLLLLVPAAFSQQARQYSFSHFTTADGLASNFINATVQDHEGYIWVATINGLQRYDGNRFLTIKARPGKAGSIPSDDVSQLYKDRRNRVWMAFVNNDVGIFQTKKLAFTPIAVDGRQAQPHYTGKYFLEDAAGNLLLHDNSELYKYDEAAKRFRPAKGLIPSPPGWLVSRYVLDSTTRRFWMCADSGIALYDLRTQHLSYRGHNTDRNPVIEQATEEKAYALHARGNDIVYGTWPSYSWAPLLFHIDAQTGVKRQFRMSDHASLTYHELGGFLRQKSGRVWIYGNPLLIEWTNGFSQFLQVPIEYRNEQSIRFDHLFSTFEDAERNVWLSTDNGLFMFNPDAQVFTAYNLLKYGTASYEAPVQASAEMKDSSLFIGCWGRGLHLFDRAFQPLPMPASLAPYQNLSVWDMCVSEKTGKLWVGLQPGGVLVYDPVLRTTVFHEPALFEKRTIRQVAEDADGNMWLGSQDGKLVKWDTKKANGDPTKGYSFILKTGQVRKIHLDNQGFIWVATLAHGLMKIDPRSGKVLQNFTSLDREGYRLFNNDPLDMTQYDDSTLIVTAGCINIIHTNSGKIDLFGTAEGLPSNTVQSVQMDDKKILWVGMLNGLCRVNLQRHITTFFDRRDGIPYDNFSSAGVEKLADGRIVFYTDHNFLVFNPAHFFQSTRPPRPTITAVTLEGRMLSLDSLHREGALDLRYDNTSVTFEFSCLSYIKQKKYHFFYMLEGVDKDWVHLDNDNRAVYNFLPAGRYRFKVKSENADGLVSAEAVSFPLIVAPPAWRTWWFYGLVILLVGLGLFVIDRERLKRLRSLQQVRTRIAGNLHQEVETTLGNINVLSEIAKIRAGTNVEQSKEFIDQISQKSRTMMEAMDDVLWSIDPKNDSMSKTLLRIKEFTEGLRSTHGIDIDLIVERKMEAMQIDMVLRHELFFFYKEALQFLILHNRCEQIFVNLAHRNGLLKLEMLSECRGDMDVFKTKFMAATGSRVEAIRGTVDVTADKKSLSVVLAVPA
jgi:ligand-binding sensor domain-containing protein